MGDRQGRVDSAFLPNPIDPVEPASDARSEPPGMAVLLISVQDSGPTMTTRRRQQGSVRKLTGVGDYSTYVTLPSADLAALKWRRGQKVVVRRSGDKLIIEDWKPR